MGLKFHPTKAPRNISVQRSSQIFAQLAKRRRGHSPDVTGTLTFGSFEAW